MRTDPGPDHSAKVTGFRRYCCAGSVLIGVFALLAGCSSTQFGRREVHGREAGHGDQVGGRGSGLTVSSAEALYGTTAPSSATRWTGE